MTFELQYGISAHSPWGRRHLTLGRIQRRGQKGGLRTPLPAERRSPRRKQGWNRLPRPSAGLPRHPYQVGGVMTLKSCYENVKERNQQLSD